VTVVPEHLVQACLHDGMLTTLSVTLATSSVTRASPVLSVGEHIVLLPTGKWFSVGAVASELHCYSLFPVFLSALDSIFFDRNLGDAVHPPSNSVIHKWQIGHV
jgi:hypothetical protein